MNSDGPICTFYLKDAYDRGSSCTFSHQRPVSGQKSSQSVCRYFLQAKCAYGEKCTRSHNTKGRTKSASSGSGTGNSKKGRSKSHAKDLPLDDEQGSEHSEVAPDHKDEADAWGSGYPGETSDPPLDHLEKLKSPCVFYSQGLCGKGNECEFSHSEPSGAGTSNGKSSYRDQDRTSNHQPISKKICKHYQRGSCRLGNECKHAHVLSDPSASNMPSETNHLSGLLSVPSMDPTPGNASPDKIDTNQKDATEHDNLPEEGNRPDDYDEDIGYVSSQDGDENENRPPNAPQTEQQDWLDDPPQHDESDWNNGLRRDRSVSESEGEGEGEDRDEHQSVNEEPKSKVAQPPRKSRGAGSYYGDGWEEREVASSPSPPPPKRPQQRTSERTNPPTRLYPHVSEVQPHWSQFADPLANSETPFCKPHAQGQCMQGESCRFRHSLTPEEYTLLFKDQQPNLWTLERDSEATGQPRHRTVQQPTHVFAYPDKQLENVAQTQPSSSGRPVRLSLATECLFYSRGKCHNGDKCPFQHIGPPPEAPDTAPLNSDREWGVTQKPKFDQVKSNLPCRYFVSRGVCHNGDSCKFHHGDILDANNGSSGASGPQSSPEPANEENDDGWNTSWKDNNNKADDGWGGISGATGFDDWTTPVDHSGWSAPNDSKPQATSTLRTNSQTCREFAQSGQCRFGDRCKFAHDAEIKEQISQHNLKASEQEEWPATDNSSHSGPWVVPPPIPCPYFAKGECRNGDQCSLLHDPLHKPTERSQETENRGNQECNVEASPVPEQSETLDENEDTWSQPWPTEAETGQPSQTKINAPCKGFGQGYCRYTADECRYLHIVNTESGYNENETSLPIQSPVDEEAPSMPADNPVDVSASPGDDAPDPEHERVPEEQPELDLPPIVFDHPEVTRFMMNCQVTFGGDSTPNEVKTASDTKQLILSDLPLDVSPTDIERLVRPYGEVRESVLTDETADSTTIKVEFATINQAVDAFQHLNGQSLQSRVIVASLGSRTQLASRSPDQKLILKVSWPNASVSAWSHYPTISKAKLEAARLNNIILRGRSINATFVTPPRTQKDAFAIKLDKLPFDATKAEVEELCKDNTLVTMNRPTYSGDPFEAIRTSLEQFGADSFDTPPGFDSRPTSISFVTFRNEPMAEAAIDSLNGRNQEFLGQQPLTIRPVHYSRYRIFLDQYKATKNEIDLLIEKCEKKCTIQFSNHYDKNLKYVRIYAPFEHGKLFADINAELWGLLRGTVLQDDDGYDVWDAYFEIPSFAKALDKLDTNAFIHCDDRTQQIKLYGPKPDCEEAQKSIFKLLSKVHGLRHEIDLPRPKLHLLVNGTFTNLQADIGINKVTLDLVNSKLIVRGSEGELSKTNMALDLLNPRAELPSSQEICQICHHTPVNAITLSCHHKYCTNCLQFAIRQTGHAPFPCIFQRKVSNGENRPCSAHVPYVIVRDILASEEKDILISSLQSHVRSTPGDLFFCPSLKCKAIYRVGGEGINLKCTLCLSEICTHCKTPAHIGLTCAEVNTSISR